jgi:hypothetical protein
MWHRYGLGQSSAISSMVGFLVQAVSRSQRGTMRDVMIDPASSAEIRSVIGKTFSGMSGRLSLRIGIGRIGVLAKLAPARATAASISAS